MVLQRKPLLLKTPITQFTYILLKRRIGLVLLILILSVNKLSAMCETMVQHYEAQHGIPEKLLMAIALVESGRQMPGKGVVPWPWTINANGKPYVLNTKHEAIEKVKELQKKGIKSIDVGCMQINLKHHPNAFKSLDEAFDPGKNIAYAASFLREKMENLGSWYGAVAHYHSASPTHNLPYKNRVIETWTKVQDYQNLNAIYARVHESGEFKTHVRNNIGRRMPIQIRFAPYTGLRGRIPPRPSFQPAVVKRITTTGPKNRNFISIKHSSSAAKPMRRLKNSRFPLTTKGKRF
jgi:hypothetical protein